MPNEGFSASLDGISTGNSSATASLYTAVSSKTEFSVMSSHSRRKAISFPLLRDFTLIQRTELFPFGRTKVLGLAMIWELRGMMLLSALSHAGDLGSVGTSPFIRLDTTVNPWELTVGTFPWIPTSMLIKPMNKTLLNILSPPRIPRYASFSLGW